MANLNLKFLRGLQSALPAAGTDGYFYLTTDTHRLYTSIDGKVVPVNEGVTTVANIDALASVTGANAGEFFYCTQENILAVFNGQTFVQINADTGATSIEVVGEGNAVTAASYDAETRKLTLTKGETFALPSDITDAVGELGNDADGKAYANVKAYVDAKTTGIATDATVAGKVDKETGKSLIADTEIARLAEMSDGANKTEASENNGSIKIDGEEVVVYTHPDKHAIADVDGLETALAGLQAKGDYATEEHTHTKEDITDFAHEHAMTEIAGLGDALAGKQDVIPENTYDVYGASAQALADAQSYADQAEVDAVATAKSYVDEEDIFVTDMNTINALGGIGANVNLNGLTTHEVLKKLLYPYVAPTIGGATASPNGGTYEKGVTKTITQVSIAITKKSEPITSVALYNGSTLIEEKTGDAVKNGGTITFAGLSVVVPTDGNQLTVKVTYPDANGVAKTESKSTTAMTFVYPYYMGTCAAGTAIDETLVESLTKKVESKGNKSCTYTVEQGYMVFAYPKAHGVLKSILDPNNFETLGNYTRHEVSVTGLDGTAQTYYVYVSGSCSVSGFTVNFKY
jgi:hypothetical protein